MQAYGAKGEVDEAISHLKKAIKLDPESKIMHQEMLALTRRKTKETESERMLYQRMLGVKSEDAVSKSNKKNNSKSVSICLMAFASLKEIVSEALKKSYVVFWQVDMLYLVCITFDDFT